MMEQETVNAFDWQQEFKIGGMTIRGSHIIVLQYVNMNVLSP